MYRKLKKIISFYVFNRNKIKYICFSISGVNLKGSKGTFRSKVDKDDAWYFALVKNSEHVFDIGSNIGYMSLVAAIQKSNKSILLVDPNPEAIADAAKNMVINGFGMKTRFENAFVSDTDGDEVKFYTVGTGEAGSMFAGHAETASAVNAYYYVKKITIDTLVTKVGYVPDLIKIDVEGAESFALMGANKTAALQKTKFIVEMHAPPELPMIENATRILNWCQSNAYQAYYLSNGQLLEYPETIAHRGKCHLLLLPLPQHFPDYLKNIKEGDSLPETIN
ncbi:MAG: FkbM family methyltransferase [Flavobacterium sp.]|nr:FkbM family methyltransferase [Flavobacterium sp.]